MLQLVHVVHVVLVTPTANHRDLPTHAPTIKDITGQKALLMHSEECLKLVNLLFK